MAASEPTAVRQDARIAAADDCPPLLLSLDSLKADRPTGVGRYTAGLIDGLLEIGVRDIMGFSFAGVEPVAPGPDGTYSGRGVPAGVPGAPPPSVARRPDRGVRGMVKAALRPLVHAAFRSGHRIVPAEMLHRWAWKREYTRMLAPVKGRVYHETNYLLRPYDGTSVVTVFDLSVLRFPEFHPAQRVREYEQHFARSLDKAARIITGSAVVAREIETMLGIAPARISTIHLGLSGAFRPMTPAERAPALARHGLADGRYVLAVGTLEPRKNLHGLLDAYDRLPAHVQKAMPLVIAGAKGWREHHFADRMDRLMGRGVVRQLGYVADSDLPALYAGARGFAFPSLYEGFGLPLIEAAACGAPVLTSVGTSMEELAGPGTVLVDPADTDAVTAGLERLLTDDDLRAEAVANAPAVARRFTWAATARATVEVYRTAAA